MSVDTVMMLRELGYTVEINTIMLINAAKAVGEYTEMFCSIIHVAV